MGGRALLARPGAQSRAAAVLATQQSAKARCFRAHPGAGHSCSTPFLPSDACSFVQEGTRIALFPDTVSDRAQRHVRELTALATAGGAAALVFVVQRGDCSAFAPCHEKDPTYARLVHEAAAAGVMLAAVMCHLDPEAGIVRFGGALPVRLDYKVPG